MITNTITIIYYFAHFSNYVWVCIKDIQRESAMKQPGKSGKAFSVERNDSNGHDSL